MMRILRMENITIVVIMLSLVMYFLECAIVEGKTLDPIYWNSSNPLFRSKRRFVKAAINDKLDIICPRKGRDDGEELFYFKLYLVSEENYRKCNATGGKRLITCNVPEREKKYTFVFQEISPSPWGLEFEPDKSYYVVSTSDGSKSGLEGLKGGVCTRFNMKLELKIQEAEDVLVPPVVPPPNEYGKPNEPSNDVIDTPSKRPHDPQKDTYNNLPEQDQPKEPTNDNGKNTENPDQVGGNGLVIGVVLGACAVLFIVLLAFLGYKLHRRRRHQKKYQSPPMTPTSRDPLPQVTLLPISPASHHGHHHHHGRLHSDHERHRSATLSSHTDMRPPPSYNESFLDNGGPVVAV